MRFKQEALPTLTIVDRDPISVCAPIRYRAYPLDVGKIPAHRLFQPRREAFRGPPAQFPLQLRGVQGVSPIMPRAIRDMRNQFAIAA